MKQEYGALFIIVMIGIAAYWYQSRHRTAFFSGINNPVTTNAGEITPEIPNSNVASATASNDWSAVPFYLTNNLPANRGGSGIMPSLVIDVVPESFGAQEILPQF